MNDDAEQTLIGISRKLDVLIALLLEESELSEDRVSKKKGTAFKVNYLANFGLNSQEIASILNSPIQSVRTLLTPARRKKNG